MKRVVTKLDPSAVAQRFPLRDLLPGWFFRVQEQSQGAYLAEDTDLWGRKVSHQGGDPDDLVRRCVASTRSLTI